MVVARVLEARLVLGLPAVQVGWEGAGAIPAAEALAVALRLRC